MNSQTNGNIKLAISSTFFDALTSLPKNIIRKTQEFIRNFPSKCQSRGFNYETIANAADPNFRSVRINDCYRAIICHPNEGNVYMLVWVDVHDKAYKWAEKHVCRINNRTTTLQIYETVALDEVATLALKAKTASANISPVYPEGGTVPRSTGVADGNRVEKNDAEQPSAAVSSTNAAEGKLFSVFTDDDLLSLGLPQDLLALTREIRDKWMLENLCSYYPSDIYAQLYWLAEGDTLENVKNAYARCQADDEQNIWEKALKNAEIAASFKVIENDADMSAVVNEDLATWRIFLHPSQTRIVKSKSRKPILVRGSAGTGKTVVALHRAVELVKNPIWDKSKKLLFTTFTANLAVDISAALKKLCPAEFLACIEVCNIDAWVLRFLKSRGVSLGIVYRDQEEFKTSWKQALDTARPDDLNLSDGFYLDEFMRIVLPQGICEENDYLRASRKGRGRVLSRAQRKKIWPLFAEMRMNLRQKNLITMEDACLLAIRLIDEQEKETEYGAVVVDETQDLGAPTLTLLARIPKKDRYEQDPCIFLVGDGHQRIYNRMATLSACGISVRGARSRKLKITYRTTDEIRRFANCILEDIPIDDMDEGLENFNGDIALRHGHAPDIYTGKSENDEKNWIAERIRELLDEKGGYNYESRDICIVARNKLDLDSYRRFIEQNTGIQTVLLSSRKSDRSEIEGLRFATMHRIKGLEFKVIFLINASNGVIPNENILKNQDDKTERENLENSERSLVYVAATRARDILFVSCYGKPSRFFRQN